jgi:hypothetical protein
MVGAVVATTSRAERAKSERIVLISITGYFPDAFSDSSFRRDVNHF